jgi:predicted TIM-barrel fold metal-dependent hydrolase
MSPSEEELAMNRRRFLTAATAALAAAPLTACRAEEETVFPIIDTHQHLWDLGKFRLPWLKDNPHLNRNFLMADYLDATADLGSFTARGGKALPGRIVKTVYMEVDVDPVQQQAEAEHVVGLCARADNPMVAAVISGRPASAGFAKYLGQFRDSAYVKGVRQVLHGPGTPPGYCLAPDFVAGIRLLGELGKSFDLCLRPGELADGAKLVDACPGTRFILDHCGNGDVQAKDRSAWQRDLAALARRPNVVCKVSGIVVTATPGKWTADDLAPLVRHTLDVFGPDRVLFGGDWPVCTKAATFRQWLGALRDIVRDRPADEQRRLFHDNAVRVYGLE